MRQEGIKSPFVLCGSLRSPSWIPTTEAITISLCCSEGSTFSSVILSRLYSRSADSFRTAPYSPLDTSLIAECANLPKTKSSCLVFNSRTAVILWSFLRSFFVPFLTLKLTRILSFLSSTGQLIPALNPLSSPGICQVETSVGTGRGNLMT